MDAIKLELLTLLRRNDFLRAALLVDKLLDPSFDPEPFVHTVMGLSAEVWSRCSSSRYDPVLKIQAINRVLFEEFGLEGSTGRHKNLIDDPMQYYLRHVLESKKGSPLTIAILYLAVAQQSGLECECLAFPSNYFLKIDESTEFYLDPFERGKVLDTETFQRKLRSAFQRHRLLSTNLYEKVSGQQLVARLLQQLKHAYILKGDALHALRAVELLTALFPQSPELTRDRGILYCEMEYFSKAMKDLRYYLKSRPNADDIGEIRKLTSMLRGYRETMN
ncbi:MAG: transglutaminase family protein [Deltaproteobacteria bacterium]|nr:transglutaminase family protein [Deltaproteobacteria bacterium]